MSKPTVGMVGLGNMGGRMARRLVDAGVPVVGFDAQRARVEAAGAKPVGDPAEVARAAEVILMSLPDSHVVEPVVRGPNGLLAGASAGATIVDLSTAAPSSTVALHAEAKKMGVRYLDAGISGGAAAAEKGTLTIMAGGDAAVLDEIRWVFEPLAAHVHHMGASGAG
ncbi:MAG TPA: NAD(P)-dependent oxidoreductase, partial [Pseudonocardia sp.]